MTQILSILIAFFLVASSYAALTSSDPFNVIIIGGSSGMGKAAAVATVRRGGDALIISRSSDKLCQAAKDIKSEALSNSLSQSIGSISTAILDVTDEESVSNFARSLDQNKWNGLVFSAAGRAPHGPITTLTTSDTRSLFETKFWGAYLCAKYMNPYISCGGSIVFVAGVLNRRPGINCSPLASTNGALEGLTRALALEFGPNLRVNCLSPGFCNTERFDHMDPSKKEAMMKNTAESLPLKRVGEPKDMGEAIYYLLRAEFSTGVVLDCDGGHHIRQYANPENDPMRQKN